MPFDPFAATFFLLSRYEEYLPHDGDMYERFPAALSWAHRSGCLHYPIVWEWAKQLGAVIQAYYPAWQYTPPGYSFEPTYDVDIPWAFRHRGLRGWLGFGKDLFTGNRALVRARLRTWMGHQEDPFYTFAYLRELHEKQGVKPRIFWLLADTSAQDINPSWRTPALQQLIRDTATWSDTGIHPGFHAWLTATPIREHKQRLEHILQQSITHSRQHFLRLRLPDTYRALIAAGIRHDHTMGFADAIGFRAGTTMPFLWYDLDKEETTELTVHPFAAMEVSLRQYRQCTPAQAGEYLMALKQYCQTNGLPWATLWHNSSFSDAHGWAGWQEVYEALFS
ncbi:MAG: polysaccharide deacetylase family protein [Saprospiraceae bacterium]